MTIVKEMKKSEMVQTMLDNNYPNAIEKCPACFRRRRSKEECIKIAFRQMQYHCSKEYIYKMFKDYLYWKIEKN
jgi:hypothetical protein